MNTSSTRLARNQAGILGKIRIILFSDLINQLAMASISWKTQWIGLVNINARQYSKKSLFSFCLEIFIINIHKILHFRIFSSDINDLHKMQWILIKWNVSKFPKKSKMHIFSVGKYVLIGEAVKENIWKNTRHCYNLPCYQRQAVSIDSNNRCRTSQANATNNYYRQHGCLTLTRKEIAGRIDMTKKSSKLF